MPGGNQVKTYEDYDNFLFGSSNMNSTPKPYTKGKRKIYGSFDSRTGKSP